MIRKIALGSLALAAIGTFVFGRDAFSYMRTGASSVREAVRGEVPVGFEIERARREIEQLGPAIDKSKYVIAQEQVAVEQLRESIAQREEDLAQQEEAILAMSEALKSGEGRLTFSGRTYTAARVQRDLAERFNRFKIAQDALERDHETLALREQALESHLQTLENMLSARRDLETELERLVARMRSIEARQSVSDLNIDDSQLARVRTLINQIDTQLDVNERLLAEQANFAGLIPVERDLDVPIDIAEQIDQYFGSGHRNESQVAIHAE